MNWLCKFGIHNWGHWYRDSRVTAYGRWEGESRRCRWKGCGKICSRDTK